MKEWTGLVDELVAKNSGDDQSVAIFSSVTRGVAKRDHAFPKDATPTVFGMSSPLSTPSRDAIDNGVAAITATDFRWLKCDVKSTLLLGNCLLRQAAADAGALEVVMFRDGYLTEGSSSNVFVVKDGMIPACQAQSRAAGHHGPCGPSSSRRAMACPNSIGRVSEQTVREADEIWVTLSTEGSAGRHDAGWQARRQRQARTGVPADAPVLSGLQADGDVAGGVKGSSSVRAVSSDGLGRADQGLILASSDPRVRSATSVSWSACARDQ